MFLIVDWICVDCSIKEMEDEGSKKYIKMNMAVLAYRNSSKRNLVATYCSNCDVSPKSKDVEDLGKCFSMYFQCEISGFS